MIKILKHSGIYTLTVEQELPISMAEAWKFLSNPGNLEKITPKQMGFFITSQTSQKAYPGQIISYNISLFPGIKTNWVTEITQVEEEKYFVDEQRFGPYLMWHHEHWIKQTNSGVMLYDKVSYKIPFGIIGQLAHRLFIKQKLTTIFTYRFNIMQTIFGVV
jgi:ligand-binding SRPBCC domain-containing protein